jgi:hypothetical protein
MMTIVGVIMIIQRRCGDNDCGDGSEWCKRVPCEMTIRKETIERTMIMIVVVVVVTVLVMVLC